MIKTNQELVAAAEKAAREFQTLYVLGCFGAPMNESNKQRYTNNLAFNKKEDRKNKILTASAETFGFDCVCFIKGLLWGWCGDPSKVYGGAAYASNGVPDIGADSLIKVCKDVSTDFSTIMAGEVVWIAGHVGLYIGNGKAAECTYRWNDGVQITRVHNILTEDGTPGRIWDQHGKLPWISYEQESKGDYLLEGRLLRQGSRGECVRALQILLAGRGCNGNMRSYDGIFGPDTEGAVKQYQKKAGLDVDGIAGKMTMSALLGV